MTLNEKIGLQLRMRRMEKKMTIEEVAGRLGVVKNTVSYMELGKKKITVEDVVKYSKIVGCDWITILKNAEEY